MKKTILNAVLLAATASVAFAQTPSPKDDSSLSTKAMEDQPGTTTGGGTDMPKAKPDDSSLATKAMKDQPGTTTGGGTTAPTAQPMDSSLSDKAMKDAPGTK
jgi:inosine/xanthosine triphosphate pyrophosphatase family protein